MATSAAVKKPKGIVVVCNTCGSENVLVDAWAEWDVEAQGWTVVETFDAAICDDCGGECSVSEKQIR
jgi:hypothetical protein